MKVTEYIPINDLCSNYQLEVTFFNQLQDVGLIEITTYNKTPCVSTEIVNDLEKMIRMHHDLNVNIQGIDVAFNLLKKIESLNHELTTLKNKLRLYEDDF
jgi:hypothetical protein